MFFRVCTFTTCCIWHKLFRTEHDVDIKGSKMSVLLLHNNTRGKVFYTYCMTFYCFNTRSLHGWRPVMKP